MQNLNKWNTKINIKHKDRSEIMVTSEIKVRVAQNCNGYIDKCKLDLINKITYRPHSCSSCVNYLREKCSEGLFNDIRETIMIN